MALRKKRRRIYQARPVRGAEGGRGFTDSTNPGEKLGLETAIGSKTSPAVVRVEADQTFNFDRMQELGIQHLPDVEGYLDPDWHERGDETRVED